MKIVKYVLSGIGVLLCSGIAVVTALVASGKYSIDWGTWQPRAIMAKLVMASIAVLILTAAYLLYRFGTRGATQPTQARVIRMVHNMQDDDDAELAAAEDEFNETE